MDPPSRGIEALAVAISSTAPPSPDQSSHIDRSEEWSVYILLPVGRERERRTAWLDCAVAAVGSWRVLRHRHVGTPVAALYSSIPSWVLGWVESSAELIEVAPQAIWVANNAVQEEVAEIGARATQWGYAEKLHGI